MFFRKKYANNRDRIAYIAYYHPTKRSYEFKAEENEDLRWSHWLLDLKQDKAPGREAYFLMMCNLLVDNLDFYVCPAPSSQPGITGHKKTQGRRAAVFRK